MVLSKIKKSKAGKKKKTSFIKDKLKKLNAFLNRPINEKRLEEIEAEKVRIQAYYPFQL
jgi:hypothetical protein